ncbi:MAG: hypothetical protein FJY73_01520 [Candidatus Eisenbacteria bacterium]|nr:hypothetical protein [Candidatus Eisenbacteria bacterium]
MTAFYYLLMLGGGAAMVAGFRMAGSAESGRAWRGIGLLYAGFAAAFLGVLLAFAPRFFSG